MPPADAVSLRADARAALAKFARLYPRECRGEVVDVRSLRGENESDERAGDARGVAAPWSQRRTCFRIQKRWYHHTDRGGVWRAVPAERGLALGG